MREELVTQEARRSNWTKNGSARNILEKGKLAGASTIHENIKETNQKAEIC